MSEIIKQDTAQLLDEWIEAERKGVAFPVPFEAAWRLAGYSRKDNAKRKLVKSALGILFLRSEEKTAGRGFEVIRLNTDGLKHLCLMAETSEGQAIRQYFIEAEKKWRLVERHAPEVATEIEILKLQLEIATQEAIAKTADEKAISLRHTIVTTCPEIVQQKVLGYQTIERVEYRDRIVANDDIVRDGSTANKTELCRRYNLYSRTGAPNYKLLNGLLERLPPEAFRLTASIRESTELDREFLPELDAIYEQQRQLNLGEGYG